MSKLDEIRAIYGRYRTLINRYRGGSAPGFIAAMIQHESGGRMDSRGDASLGEVGLMQITSSFPPSIGVSPDLRYTEEGNIFLGCIEQQIEAVKMFLAYPTVVRLGTADSWKLARLAFAVGSGGTKALIRDATGGNPLYAGNVYGAIKSYALRTGAQGLGTQSAATVQARILAIEEQWALGALVAPAWVGPPTAVPAPSGVRYALPADVARYMSSPAKQILILGVLLTGTILLARRLA